MRLRTTIFWLHLPAGVLAGGVVLVMSATGALLAYEKLITTWADGYVVATPAPGAARLPVEALLARAREARPGSTPSALTLRAEATAPAMVQFGREASLFLDPFTGSVFGEGSHQARAFFRAVTEWHRFLGMVPNGRELGRGITGASNLAFLLIVLSGLYLWWPDQWTRSVLRSIVFFRGGLRGKARDFNWHNTIGIWCFLPLAFVIATAVPMSYPWANDLLYRLVGDVPAPRPSGPGPGRPPAEARGESERRAPALDGPLDLVGLDALWRRAEQQVPGWQSITLRIPSSPRPQWTFSIDASQTGAIRPDQRSELTLDRRTAEVVRYEPYTSLSPGRRLRGWIRFTHTGEAFGLLGQAIAGTASLGATVLVWTGLALAARRFLAWCSRRSRARAATALQPDGSSRDAV
jgi:uncharacterized iron-regulated membrane protein